MPILGVADVSDSHRGLPHDFDRNLVDLRDGLQLAVGINAVIERSDLHITGGQDEVCQVQRPDYVHQAQLVGLQFVGIGIHHDLAVSAAERRRDARARYAGDLVSNLKLRQVAQLCLIQTLALARYQAHR